MLLNVTVKKKIKAIFIGRHVFLWAVLLGTLLALPSLCSGLWMDDYQQRTTLLTAEDGNPFEFYRMGTPATEALLQSGVLPWWTHPASRLVFFRPVAQWLMQLDYQWWPDNIPLMHLHSVFWYALLVAVVALVYRRLMPVSLAAGFAAVLFAIDANHGGAVAWLANRNAMVAMIGSMLALLCYERKQWRWQIVGCFFFAASMACAEAALAITGYLFAYEVFLSQQRWRWRILRLLPYTLIALLWLAFWHHRGYGSAGPGFYTDPASDPLVFLHAMMYRAPAFLLGQLSTIPVEIFWTLEDSKWYVYAFIGILTACGILIKLFWPLLKDSALARFYVLGMCIATIPICGSQLVSRSLWYVGFGAIGLLALLFAHFFSIPGIAKSGARRFVYTLLVLHFAISPLLFLVGIGGGSLLDKYMDSRALHLPDAKGTDKQVLVLSVPQFEIDTYYPLLKDEALSLGTVPSRPKPAIAKLRLLINGTGDFELWRKDANTLVAHRHSGFTAMRKDKYGFSKGEQVTLDDVVITVREITAEHAAAEIEYHFNPGVLDNYTVLAWQGDHFVPTQLPTPGKKMWVKTLSSGK